MVADVTNEGRGAPGSAPAREAMDSTGGLRWWGGREALQVAMRLQWAAAAGADLPDLADLLAGELLALLQADGLVLWAGPVEAAEWARLALRGPVRGPGGLVWRSESAGAPLLHRVIERGRPIRLRLRRTAVALPSGWEGLVGGMETLLLWPLLAPVGAVGLVAAVWAQPVSRIRRALLQTLGEALGSTLAMVLQREAARRSGLSAAVSAVAEALVGPAGLPEVLRAVLTLARGALRLEGGRLALWRWPADESQAGLVCAAVAGEDDLEGKTWPAARSLAATGAEPRWLLAGDPGLAGLPWEPPVLVVALDWQGQVLGLLTLDRLRRAPPLGPGERQVLRTIADLVASGLATATLAERLRAALAVRDQFLSIAAHELKTPLAILKGYVQWLLWRPGGDPAVREILRVIERQCNRLDWLVNQMLDVSRIQTGRLELQPEPFDLAALVREVVQRMAITTTRHSLRVVAPETVPIVADRYRLEEVLVNLLDNAIRYSPDGGPVEVGVVPEEAGVLLTVRDQGIGIPTALRERVFEPFVQARPGVAPTQGMGLGLYIVKELVGRHGGRVWFTSQEGVGTTFYVWLPRTPTTQPTDQASVPPPPRSVTLSM